ncbi:hypothetical protein [Olleya sp. Hel_I_94]|uniref:hypothetical protein n=1 Tax=Olleya sp. Hel_I_94 TaxID=1250001 RepID=UPI0011A95DE1|nr:hypothetical protein [Olleya sp. Hel_I_94]|tara:strand:- start:39867 stop:40568 length:702 start_codon:yes stop_codon:yes gene_type:complete
MIKFFRKIRQKMLTENKFSKYLIYAIGEIILVTIGVLLAIQANNYNEKQKDKKNINNIYARINTDIENNINIANKLIAEYNDMEYLYHKVLNDSINSNDIGQGLENLATGFILYEFDKTGIDQLKKLHLRDRNSVDIIRIYDRATIQIKASTEIIESSVSRNLLFWSDNYPWFPDYVKFNINNQAKDYFVNSQDYKNKVSYFYLCVYQSYIPTLENFISELKAWQNNIENNEG